MISGSRVAIIYKYLPQYRRRFFELLKDRLSQDGIELVLIYGQPGSNDKKKNDAIDFDWAVKVPNRIISIRRREFYWQPVWPLIKDVDLVIVEQANKLLINYLLLLQNALGIKKVAYWGHGKNFQANESNRLSEAIKQFLARKPFWWFSYNEVSAEVVRGAGYPDERITIVQNAIDTRQLKNTFENLKAQDIEAVRKELGINSDHVGLYVGGMYPEKCLDFLLDACNHIRSLIPDFEMIFIGSGVEAYKIKAAAEKCPWIHYVGPKFEDEKVPYFACSKVFLMPGLVGLAVLDCFTLEIPLVTTNYPGHSPEIEYLENGYNGLILDDVDDPKMYGQAVADLLGNEERRLKLVEGCRDSKAKYTVENMVERFACGVEKALRVSK